jgi:putative ABC transport system ATP-binding protein
MSTLYHLSEITKDFRVGEINLTALFQVDLTIEEGQFVALMGPSGSGKSTLLNILGLLEVPTKGSLCFFGKTLEHHSETELTKIRRSAIGFIFQNFNLLPVLTALENVEYPLNLMQGLSVNTISRKSKETLARVGLENFLHHRPAQLSGGQRQRVAIARALVKDPKVILADEPTANLDSQTAGQIIQLLKEIQSTLKTTVIVATHDSHVAKSAGCVVFLRDGALQPEAATRR